MNQDIQTLSGNILLLRNEINWDIFRLQFFDDWDVEIGGETTPTELAFTINGAHVLCLLCNSKVDQAEQNVGRNYAWPQEGEEVKKHTAHVQIYVMDCENDIQRHVLFSMIASSMMKQRYVIGLYQYPITRNAEDYIGAAQQMAKDEMPVLEWIYIGLYQDAEGLWNAYTYGMEEFHKMEIEILHTKASLMEMYKFLAQTVIHLITTNDELVPGERIGSDAVHNYMVTKSLAVALSGESLKIEF